MTLIRIGGSILYFLCFMRWLSFLIFLISFSTFGTAQNTSTAPHGGQLKTSGYYRVEVVDCSGYLEVYLYELNMRPVSNYNMTGKVDFHYPDNTCVTSPLFPYGVDSFTAEPEHQLYKSCEVFIQGRSFSVQAKFEDLVCTRQDE